MVDITAFFATIFKTIAIFAFVFGMSLNLPEPRAKRSTSNVGLVTAIIFLTALLLGFLLDTSYHSSIPGIN